MALTKPLYNQLAEKLLFIVKSEDYKKIRLPEDVIKLPIEIRKILTLKINEKYINIPYIGNINIELAKTMLCAKATKEQPKYDEKTQNMILELEKQICHLNEEKKKKNVPDILVSITRKTEILTKLKIPKEHKDELTPATMISIAHQIHEIMFKSIENAEKMYNVFVELVQPSISVNPTYREYSYKQDNSWKKVEYKKIEHKKYDTKYVPKIAQEEITSTNVKKYVPPVLREDDKTQTSERKINVVINEDFISLDEIYNRKKMVQKEEKKPEIKPEIEEEKEKTMEEIMDELRRRPIVVKVVPQTIQKVPEGCVLVPTKSNFKRFNLDDEYNSWISNCEDYYFFDDIEEDSE